MISVAPSTSHSAQQASVAAQEAQKRNMVQAGLGFAGIDWAVAAVYDRRLYVG